jgi:tetratricopeptide (TPR) repeat protein
LEAVQNKLSDMPYLPALFLAVLLSFSACGQTATQLYTSKNYKALAKLEPEAAKLKPTELYMVGFAFYQLGDNGSVYFYKGLSLRYQHRYPEALQEVETALKREPNNQEFMNEKGLIVYAQGQKGKALEIFEQAKKLPNTFPEPYFWAARIHHENQEFEQALTGYYETLKVLPQTNSHHVEALAGIGQLEYTFTSNYKKSAKAYAMAIELDKENYALYYKLMKSYNADQAYSKADSVFMLVKEAFQKNRLPEEDMAIKTVTIAQFKWHGQIASINRSLLEPKQPLDITYKIFLLDEKGEKVVRRFVVEKTIPLEKNDAKYLLCEQVKSTGAHITYPYGWAATTISAGELQKGVELVLNGKMKQAASSNFSK